MAGAARRAGLGLTTLAVLAGCGSAAVAVQGARRPAFDAAAAYEHVRQLVSIGPRTPGSPGAAEARRYIAKTLTAAGLTTEEQAFTATTPIGPLSMVNVRAAIPGRSRDRVLVAGHYDTKIFREFRFVGANDGGSSTAVVLELGRALAARQGPFTIELVFFDGEEATIEWEGTDNRYGSRHYVEAARKAGTLASIRALILLDMVGDRHLTIRRETLSTSWMTDLVWASARRLGHGAVFLNEPLAVEDDHVPFLRAGIPAVDIIDLDYAAWHTAGDTLDKVSARSLQVVGDVVLDALPAIEARLQKTRR